MTQTAEAGYFCYDEMFLFATELLKAHPDIQRALAYRFPVVMIDEMQDTSDQQSAILSVVFPRSTNSGCVQRAGDQNQAIYSSGSSATPDAFPDGQRVLPLSNSYRFDQTVANLAHSCAGAPLSSPGLIGMRIHNNSLEHGRHKIFVFPDDDTSRVLMAYGQHVLEVLPMEVISGGKIAAVGEVHAGDPTVKPGDKKYPKSVAHYWNGYRADLAGRRKEPRLMVDRVRLARAALRDRPNAAAAVDSVGTGIIRLLNLCTPQALVSTARPHRRIERMLADQPDLRAKYRSLITECLFGEVDVTAESWKGIAKHLSNIVRGLAGVFALPPYAWELLDWAAPLAKAETAHPVNTVTIGDQVMSVDIALSSIHAVKGETHVATLLLDTFFYSHTSKKLIKWLVGDRIGGSDCGEQDIKRLRAAYVALTRPTHVICIAVRESSLGPSPAAQGMARAKLGQRGWVLENV